MDTDNAWPNGASIVETYRRQFSQQGLGTAFPYVPDNNTFVNLNLTAKPTFFGCYSSNLTDLMEEVNATQVPPLIVYIANRPYSYYSNTSTYKMTYDTDEMLELVLVAQSYKDQKNNKVYQLVTSVKDVSMNTVGMVPSTQHTMQMSLISLTRV
ncbi:unnamed protein product [[Candida] boidinii]|nr:unnamed protein product [[Candida] boidinii]